MSTPFKQTMSLERRLALSQRILLLKTGIPVIVERGETTSTPSISKHKYIVSRDITFAKFAAELRKNISKIDSSTAIFYYVGDQMVPPCTTTMTALYDKYRDEDGFLYITYSCESTFG
jgi:GABA(A) receptor-associated protein